MSLLFVTDCGRKGPALPPLRPTPNPVAGLTARRIGDRIDLQFTLPAANQDGTKPAALERVDIYARSVPEGSPLPTNDQVIDKLNLIGHLSVRPPEAEDAPEPAPDAPKDPRPGAGEAATFVDRIPAGPPQPLPKIKGAPVRPAPPAPVILNPATPAAPPPPPLPVTRYLMLASVSPKGRQSRPAMLAVPLTDPPVAPADPTITYDETTLTLRWTWTPAPDSEAKPAFRVFNVDAGGNELGGPLTVAPLTTAEFATPVEFGKERCFAVRSVQVRGAVAIESDAVQKCETPVDTFPPKPPANLDAIADEGVITLAWDPVTAADLAGYIVLRGEGTGDKLLPLTSVPIAQASYRDTTVRSGVTYVYAVVAVDKATPPNRSSNSELKTVTAR